MKKLLMLVIATICISTIQAQPVAQNGTFYVEDGPHVINVAPLVTGGTPPYYFNYLINPQPNPPFINLGGTMTFIGNPHGMLEVRLIQGSNLATLQFRVRDSNGEYSNNAEIRVIRGTPKG